MDLLEAIEQVARNGVAEAVLEDDESAAVLCRCSHARDLRVTAHERTVGAAAAVLEAEEEGTLVRSAHADHAVVLIDGVVRIGRGVGHVARHVVHEVLRSLLDGDVLRVAVHAAHVAVYHLPVVARQRPEGHARHLGELLRGIIGAQRCPVVVCAQEDILLRVSSQRGVDIHRLHVRSQVTVHVVNRRPLRSCAVPHLLRTVVFHRRGDHHTVDVHVGERLLVFVGRLRIARAALARAAVGHQCAHPLSRAHDDDARIGNLRVLVGPHVVVRILGDGPQGVRHRR